jgi:hypothetical protein
MNINNAGQAKAYAALGKRSARRREIDRIVELLHSILAAEEAYRDAIPENLQASTRYDAACDAADGLEEAIALLECVY